MISVIEVFICFLSFCLLRLCSRFVECRLGRGRSANTISQHLIVFHDLDTGAVLHAATNPAPVNTMPIAVPAGNIPAMVLDTDASLQQIPLRWPLRFSDALRDPAMKDLHALRVI
jgi:hypothetical protein